jgi:hypothetical protein
MSFNLADTSAWLVDQAQAFGTTEAVTYTQTGQADVSGVDAVFGETTHEQIDDRDGTLVEVTSQDFVFRDTELGRTPQQGDLITRSNGEIYRVLPFGQDEQCYRLRGEMLRVFSRKVTNAS